MVTGAQSSTTHEHVGAEVDVVSVVAGEGCLDDGVGTEPAEQFTQQRGLALPIMDFRGVEGAQERMGAVVVVGQFRIEGAVKLTRQHLLFLTAPRHVLPILSNVIIDQGLSISTLGRNNRLRYGVNPKTGPSLSLAGPSSCGV